MKFLFTVEFILQSNVVGKCINYVSHCPNNTPYVYIAYFKFQAFFIKNTPRVSSIHGWHVSLFSMSILHFGKGNYYCVIARHGQCECIAQKEILWFPQTEYFVN